MWVVDESFLGKDTVVATVVITIDLPPTGELETSGDGTAPTDAQMAEESQARQEFRPVGEDDGQDRLHRLRSPGRGCL